jgi:hypothetical protein
MTPEQFSAIKAKLECWPGHEQVPPGAVRIWIDNKMADDECRRGVPSTGYRVR